MMRPRKIVSRLRALVAEAVPAEHVEQKVEQMLDVLVAPVQRPVYAIQVRTRHPQDFVLIDRATGDTWQMVPHRETTPGEDGEGVWRRFRGTVTVTDYPSEMGG